MKKLQSKPSYLFFLLLMASALLLAACGTAAATASAAQIDPVAIEDTIEVDETAEIIESDPMQEEFPIDEDEKNRELTPLNQTTPNNGNGPGTPGQGGQPIPAGDLSELETEALLFMREEEKLARDVYLTMYELWGKPTFSNIAGSEQAHMDAVAYLLEAYDLPDPAAGKAVGEFSNPELQALYDQLIAQGQGSLEAALLVGGAIEEIDILDLQENLAVVENAAVAQVFENLLAGSINHLNAFASVYERQTQTPYVPQYMSQEAFDALFDGTSGPGGPGGGSGGPGNGPGGGGSGGNGGGSGGNGNGPGRGNGGRGRNTS